MKDESSKAEKGLTMTGAKKLFFSQSMLDTMIDAGKIKLENAIMTMLSGDNPTFELQAAFRFVKTFDDGPDPNNLVGTIRTEQELRDLLAEIYLDSVIYKDVAYQVDPGYIGSKRSATPPAPPAAAAKAPAPSPAVPAAPAPVAPPAAQPASPEPPPPQPAAAPEAPTPPSAAAETELPADPDQLSKYILDNLL